MDTKAECPICFELFNGKDRAAKCLPCSQGHVVCEACLEQLMRIPAPFDQCFLHRSHCDANRPHATCPLCKDVFHLPQDDINLVLSVPNTEEEIEVLVQQRRQLRRHIQHEAKELRKLGQAVVQSLEEFMQQLNQHHFNCNVARVSGSAPAVVGGVMFITGAALAFVTFGASAGLMAVGGVMAGAGGLTAGGASVVELIIDTQAKKKIDLLINECQQKYKQVTDLLQRLVIEDSIIDVGLSFWMHSSVAVGHLGRGVGSVMGVVRLCVAAADVAGDAAGSAVRLMTAAGRVLHVVGTVAAVIMLPIDVINMVWSSVEIHRRTPSRLSEKLLLAIEDINRCCLTTANQVEAMLMTADDDLREEINGED